MAHHRNRSGFASSDGGSPSMELVVAAASVQVRAGYAGRRERGQHGVVRMSDCGHDVAMARELFELRSVGFSGLPATVGEDEHRTRSTDRQTARPRPRVCARVPLSLLRTRFASSLGVVRRSAAVRRRPDQCTAPPARLRHRPDTRYPPSADGEPDPVPRVRFVIDPSNGQSPSRRRMNLSGAGGGRISVLPTSGLDIAPLDCPRTAPAAPTARSAARVGPLGWRNGTSPPLPVRARPP